MWGYNGQFPGPTIMATRNVPIAVRMINNLPARHPVIRQEGVTSTHLHGRRRCPSTTGTPTT